MNDVLLWEKTYKKNGCGCEIVCKNKTNCMADIVEIDDSMGPF